MKKIRNEFADTVFEVGSKDEKLVVVVGLVMELCNHLQKIS